MRFGAQIAAACQAEPSILGITEKTGSEDALLHALLSAQDIFREHDLTPELITKSGTPEHEIVKRTMENRYDLVVIGARAKTLFGGYSTPGGCPPCALTKSSNPSSLPCWWSFAIVLPCIASCCAPSGAAFTDKAIEFAGKIARCSGAVVNLFHVMPEPPAMYADLIRLEEDSHRVLESNSKLGRVLRHQKDLLE